MNTAGRGACSGPPFRPRWPRVAGPRASGISSGSRPHPGSTIPTGEPRMPRIAPLEYAEMPPEAQAAHDEHLRTARITNMKRTLLHSAPAFQALMTWYPLRDTVQPFLGERLTTLFAHAVSAERSEE